MVALWRRRGEEYLIPDLVNSKIIVTNGRILQGPEVSDHAIALLLSISRNILPYLKSEKQKCPDQ